MSSKLSTRPNYVLLVRFEHFFDNGSFQSIFIVIGVFIDLSVQNALRIILQWIFTRRHVLHLESRMEAYHVLHCG